LDLKTDKVIVSEKLSGAGEAELTAIQTHTTVRIASSKASDIKKVAAALK
jgi:hypothetical protein